MTDAVTEPVDVVLNLVRASDDEMAAWAGLVRPGGVLVTTTTPAPEDPERGVRTVGMFVRGDAQELAAIAAKVDSGAVRVDVSGTYPLPDTALVHERSAAGEIPGEIVLVPDA